MKKICSRCKIEKELSEFHKQKDKKYGVKSRCKVCANEVNRNRYNKDEYREYYILNKEKINKRNREYHHKNKEVINIRHKKYLQDNREVLNSKQRNKYNNDILFKLNLNTRNLINISIKNCGYRKSYKTQEILGCTIEEFKLHLESQFEDWMTWDNRGLYNGEENYGWDIDHIIPVSSANTEEEVIELNHYTNLQPLCSHINRNIKKDKINYGK